MLVSEMMKGGQLGLQKSKCAMAPAASNEHASGCVACAIMGMCGIACVSEECQILSIHEALSQPEHFTRVILDSPPCTRIASPAVVEQRNYEMLQAAQPARARELDRTVMPATLSPSCAGLSKDG